MTPPVKTSSRVVVEAEVQRLQAHENELRISRRLLEASEVAPPLRAGVSHVDPIAAQWSALMARLGEAWDKARANGAAFGGTSGIDVRLDDVSALRERLALVLDEPSHDPVLGREVATALRAVDAAAQARQSGVLLPEVAVALDAVVAPHALLLETHGPILRDALQGKRPLGDAFKVPTDFPDPGHAPLPQYLRQLAKDLGDRLTRRSVLGPSMDVSLQPRDRRAAARELRAVAAALAPRNPGDAFGPSLVEFGLRWDGPLAKWMRVIGRAAQLLHGPR